MSGVPSLPMLSYGLLCSFHHSPLLRFRSRFSVIPQRTLRCNLSKNDTIRRSADYQPTAWNYDFLASLPTDDFTMLFIYRTDKYGEQRENMIIEVKDVVNNHAMDPVSRLELVDAIERLGLKRHFKEDIKRAVKTIYKDTNGNCVENLYASALRFRVLRQHGYVIPEDIFNKFKDKSGNFCKVFAQDVKGLLSLYEASFLAWEGDDTLGVDRAFAAQYLKEHMGNLPEKSSKEIQQALELPLHWRFPRLKALLSIEAYDQCDTHHLHPTLMRLAKLDFNLLQCGYREEIKRLARWWTDLDLPRKLPYSRDRLMEHYLWTVGLVEEPEHRHYREMETKVVNLITAIDDTYDIYGTVEELEILTNLIDRWEISGVDQLPKPMRHCYLAIYNTSNEIADWTLKEKGFHIIPYMSKAWARLCKKYLQEAKWYQKGYKPHLTEYLRHAIVSIAAHLMLLDCYFLTTTKVSNEALDFIDNLPNLLRYGGTITRLSNDLATSSAELARGDTIKALECYVSETGASEQAAREHINGLIHQTWKKINKEYYLFPSQYPATISEPFLGANINLARTSQFFYNFKKDWHGKPDKEMMEHMRLLLIDPIPMHTVNLS